MSLTLIRTARTVLSVLAAFLVLLVAGHAAEAQALKIGILHIGSMADGGYNQAHAEGIQAMKRNLPGVEIIEVENVPEGADAERVMENMVKQGAKLIVAASFGYLEPALRVAAKYPDVKFFHPGGYKRAPNLTTYWASTPEAFYLMGMAAGKTTKTNKLGYVVALPISFFLANINAFELGARSVNPKAETRVVFTGTFLDPAKEATAANALLDQGVDVLGVIVDSPITVVQTAEKRNAYSVGYHSLGAQKFAPKGWIGGIAFTWGISTRASPGRSRKAHSRARTSSEGSPTTTSRWRRSEPRCPPTRWRSSTRGSRSSSPARRTYSRGRSRTTGAWSG